MRRAYIRTRTNRIAGICGNAHHRVRKFRFGANLFVCLVGEIHVFFLCVLLSGVWMTRTTTPHPPPVHTPKIWHPENAISWVFWCMVHVSIVRSFLSMDHTERPKCANRNKRASDTPHEKHDWPTLKWVRLPGIMRCGWAVKYVRTRNGAHAELLAFIL